MSDVVKRLETASNVRANAVTIDTTDPALSEAWEKIRSGDAVNWALFGYADKNKLKLDDCGTNGLAELSTKFDPAAVQYAVFRCTATDDHGSARPKYVFITWVGPSVAGMARARASQHSSGVKRLVDGCHLDIQAAGPEDLDVAEVQKRLIASSGAHAPKEIKF